MSISAMKYIRHRPFLRERHMCVLLYHNDNYAELCKLTSWVLGRVNILSRILDPPPPPPLDSTRPIVTLHRCA